MHKFVPYVCIIYVLMNICFILAFVIVKLQRYLFISYIPFLGFFVFVYMFFCVCVRTLKYVFKYKICIAHSH